MNRRRTLALASMIALALIGGAVTIWRDELRTMVRDIKHSPTRPIPQRGDDAPRFDAQHQRILNLRSQGPFDVIFLGDSITEFWLEPLHRPIWTKHFGHLRAANFGVSSDGTQNVLWRITEGKELDGIEPPKLVVLMIGTNNMPTNSASAIARGVESIVRTIQAKFPTTKILVLSILPRERDGDQINARIRATNVKLASLDDGRLIQYLDISFHFVDAQGRPAREMFADGLHLNAAGYEALGTATRPAIDEMLSGGE